MEYAAPRPTSLQTAFHTRSTAQVSRLPFRSPGRLRHEVSSHMSDARAGWRRAEPFSHRLHGLEGPSQCSRPDAHLPASLERPAPGRLSRSIEESREARFRLLGRLRAEFRRPAHPVRECRLFGLLEPRCWGEPEYPDVRFGRLWPLSAGIRHQGRFA